MIRASDLSPAVRAKLGIVGTPKKGRPKQDESANREFVVQCLALKLPPMAVQWRFTNSQHPNSASRKWRADCRLQADLRDRRWNLDSWCPRPPDRHHPQHDQAERRDAARLHGVAIYAGRSA